MTTKLSERFVTDPAPLPLGGDELIEMSVPGSAPYTVVGTTQDIADLPPATPLPVANGGTASTTASAARTALGLGTLATQSGTFSGTSSGTNTGDQSSVSGNAGTATALATARNIDGQSFNGTADITVIAPGTHAATSKATPVDADELPLVDSAASNVLKKLTWANLKATLKTYFDTLYVSISGLGSGVATFLATPTSANLAAALTDETGTGANVFANTPTLVTPVLGAATGTSVVLSSTATASALIPSGSTVPANGVYLPAANSVGIATNSTNAVTIDASQRVGIGVTPSFKLDCPFAVRLNSIERSAAGQLYINASDSTGFITLNTAGGERMKVDSAGIISMAALPALSYASDAAAAAGGVPVGGLYNTAGAVKVRLT